MAAGKDYGPRGGRRKATQVKSEPTVPGWIWMIVGLSIGLAIAAGVYILRPTEPMAVAERDRRPTRGADPAQEKTIEVPPENKRWLFYDLLEDYELVVPPEPTEKRRARPRPEPGSYLIQVGSFSSAADAERRRASLLLLDIDSRVRRVSIDGRDTWYRVQVGPLTDGDRIVEILERLDENDIDSLMIRAKG